jgi:prepilin-type N-terminal cleavage/methylation domain-containing protein
MRRRPGVTLIELLVVIGIITALATMIVAIAPRFGERQRASRGASQLQSWLNLAKQRALRDRRPVGIRMPYLANSSFVTELQYVELPDEGVGGTVTVPYPPNPNNAPDYQFIKFVTPVQFTPNDQQLQNSPSALIQTGDAITFPDRPLGVYSMRRIAPTKLPPPPTPDDGVMYVSKDTSVNPVLYTYRVRLDQPLPPANFTTQSHIFTRKARPVVGEPVLQLPKDIAIDISRDPANPPKWYRMFPPTANTSGTQPFDILFSPAGQVIGAEGNLGSRICLWVRDVSLGDPGPTELPPGYNTLITIYTRTGHVTAHEVDSNKVNLTPNVGLNPTWNPFQFTQDGLTSGY